VTEILKLTEVCFCLSLLSYLSMLHMLIACSKEFSFLKKIKLVYLSERNLTVLLQFLLSIYISSKWQFRKQVGLNLTRDDHFLTAT
jgi:hypothetical protein